MKTVRIKRPIAISSGIRRTPVPTGSLYLSIAEWGLTGAGRPDIQVEGARAMSADFPPRGSCDSHVHVIGPKRRFPLPPGHRYTPMDAPMGNLAAMLKRLGSDRVVIIQPSFYALAASGSRR